jgi:tRNA pseudouridine55 synthase
VPGQQRDTGRPATWESGLVIVDKPGGMTSHDVVARIRRLAHTRRVGHAGTLDPMATGVLVIGIEKATRLLGHLMLTEKTYEATIRLGQSTSTDDAEGQPTGTALRPASGVTREALDTEVAALTGEILQVPSSVSAIKVNGQRAYKLTRAGEAPELAARPVTIYEFDVTAAHEQGDFLDVDATVRCSSGTYIRALARDLGAALGTGGHLTALRRTAVGPYNLAQAHTLKELEDQTQHDPERVRLTPLAPVSLPAGPAVAAGPPSPRGESGSGSAPLPRAAAAPGTRPGRAVIPLAEAAAAAFPRLDLTADEARRLAQGARLPLPATAAEATAGDESPVAAFDPDGTLVALVTGEGGRLRSLAVFVDAAAKTHDFRELPEPRRPTRRGAPDGRR